jgi:dipeptidyl aminopeptidase/acylaminoacyl peptidase
MNPFKTEAYDHEARGSKGWDVMVDDFMSGVDELIRRGIVDPDRMGLYGFSNGGGVVTYLLTRTQRFKCAVVVAGVYPDWSVPFFLETDSTVPEFAGGILPWEDPGWYVRLSVVYRLDRISAPILLADGNDDGPFLLGTIEVYNGLRRLGRDVTFLRYPGQGHGFEGPAMKDFWERENAFFDRYLKPEPPPN